MELQRILFQELDDNLSAVFERVLKQHAVFSVQKSPGQAVVMLDANDYAGLLETLYLLSQPANAVRLREGVEQHRAGKVKEIDVTAYLD